MPTANARSERLSMRVSPEALATIREASAAQQQDVSSIPELAALIAAVRRDTPQFVAKGLASR